MLGKIIRDIFRPAERPAAARAPARRVLNVGGANKATAIPPHYNGWEQLLLDIDPRGKPDIVCDARDLRSLEGNQFDAIYCSHNLEHYYRHDAVKVLLGMHHVLKPDGFVEVVVPDLETVIEHVLERKMDVSDVLYESPAGPITVLDVIYGFGKEIEESGQDFYAHKTGFSPKNLRQTLIASGFHAVYVFVARDAFEVRAFAFKSAPTLQDRNLLGLPSAMAEGSSA